MGQDPDKVEKAFDEAPMHSDEKMLQSEGVLLHLLKPTRFVSKKCKREECGEVFGTSYRAVAYCSDNCRAKDLENQTGIRWNPHTDRYQNLQGERPLVVGPQAYQTLIEFAQWILRENNLQIDQSHIQSVVESEPESLPEQSHQQMDDPQTSPVVSLPPSNVASQLDLENPFDF